MLPVIMATEIGTWRRLPRRSKMSAVTALIITNLFLGTLLMIRELQRNKREAALIDRLLEQSNILPLDFKEPIQQTELPETVPTTKLVFPLPR